MLTDLMTMDELDRPDLQVEGVLPRHALVFNSRTVHQLIRRPLQRDPVQRRHHAGSGPGDEGRRVEREVAWDRGRDVLRQHHHVVLACNKFKVCLMSVCFLLRSYDCMMETCILFTFNEDWVTPVKAKRGWEWGLKKKFKAIRSRVRGA